MDLQFSLWVQELSNPLFDIIGKIMNFLGEKGMIFIICAIVLIIIKKTRIPGMVLFVALGATGLCTEIVKEIVSRPRPFVDYPAIEPLYHETSLYSSFPSGHTSMAFAFATIIAIFFPKFRIPVFIIAITMGFTRVYGFVHYLTDVIAGALIGIIVALIVYKIYEKFLKNKKGISK